MTRQRSCGEFGGGGLEQRGVLERGLGVVDRAGADDDEQAVVLAGEDVADLVARFEDGGGSLLGDGQLFFEENGREDHFRPL